MVKTVIYIEKLTINFSRLFPPSKMKQPFNWKRIGISINFNGIIDNLQILSFIYVLLDVEKAFTKKLVLNYNKKKRGKPCKCITSLMQRCKVSQLSFDKVAATCRG